MRFAIFRSDRRLQGLRTLALLAIILASCAPPAPEPAAVRLTDLYPGATVEGAVQPTFERPAIEWRFQGDAARSDGSPAAIWESLHGIADLTQRKGLLVGTTTGYPPLLHLQRTPDPQDLDLVAAVQVRMKTSRGGRLALGFAAGEELDRERLLGFAANAPLQSWPANAALLPGERMQTYVLTPEQTFRAPESRHLFLLPTDVPEAEFAIESVRLVLRRERLAATPSGPGWHGLGGIYRETVVARVPETVRYRLRLPPRPRLEVALGTLVPDPVTFRVTVTGGGEPVVVLEDTVTTPGRWESLAVDLAAFGGEAVELALQLVADHEELVGLWGSPVIRNLGGRVPRAQGVIPSGVAPEPEPVSIRLTDLFPTATVEGTVAPPPGEPRTEWRFGEEGSTGGWESFHGVADLTIRDALLVATTTDELPLLHAERTRGPYDEDLLDAIEVRLRASRGSRLSVALFGGRQLGPAAAVTAARDFPARTWVANSPLVPGEAVETYVMTPKWPVTAAEVRHLLLRPTDVAGAELAIESVRLIFRRERLAAVPPGVGWHGLGEIYRPAVASRVPETIRYHLRLPSRPRLDLGLGTLDAEPVTFRVAVGRAGGPPEVVNERTLTTPQRWQTAQVDLSALAGEWVDLSLSLAGERQGAVGLWGSPTIRNLGRKPAVATAAGETPQGVILIIADNLRADHLEAYGYERQTAPVLTRMAAEGARFEDCITLAPWTKASVPSILTSLEPLTHGVLRFSDRLPPAAVTLAEQYRDAGFATLSFFSIFYTGQRSGTEQGFDELHDDRSITDLRWGSKTSREYVDRLLPWLEAHREVPFFVVLHVLDAHFPFEPRPPYDVLWADPERKAEHARQTEAVAGVAEDPFMRATGRAYRADLERVGIDPDRYISVEVDWYDGSIRGLDAELGRLLARLRHLGLAESTLIALISDHGEEFFEHGRVIHGHTVYGELTGVPLILRGPGVPPGTVVTERVRTIDLMPTLLELSGLPQPEGIQGQSLVPLLRPGENRRWREEPALIERVYPERWTQLMNLQSFALVDGDWKLIEITERGASEPEYHLYAARTDPLDRHDLAPRYPEVVARLRGELERRRDETTARRLAPGEGSMDRLSGEALERLRSLGYIQ